MREDLAAMLCGRQKTWLLCCLRERRVGCCVVSERELLVAVLYERGKNCLLCCARKGIVGCYVV